MMIILTPPPCPILSEGMNVSDAPGSKSAFTICLANDASPLNVTGFARYGSRLINTKASFWKCWISHFFAVAFRVRSSRHHRNALYALMARLTNQATRPYHSIPRFYEEVSR